MRHPRRGAALFVVLLFSAFVAALAAAATRTGLSGARAAAVFADGIRAEALGRAAADALAYRIVTGDAAAKRGGAVGFRLPNADVTIDYVSESARVDVNAAPVTLISALLGAAGAEPSEVEAVAGRVERFRAAAAARAKRASGADGATPQGGLAGLRAQVDALSPVAKPKPPAGPASIRDASEVAGAWGLSDALARRLLPSLTVTSGAAAVDPLLADRTVLLALLGGDDRVDDYQRQRQRGFADKDAALALLPVPSRAFASFDDVPAVRAAVRVRVANRFERRYEIVMVPPGEGQGSNTAGTSGAASDGLRGAAPDDAQGAPPPGRGVAPVVASWRVLP